MNVRRLCAIAGVSRCGFYKYYNGYQSNRALKDKVIAEAVDEIQQRHHFSVGYRKMVPLLQRESGMKTSPRKSPQDHEGERSAVHGPAEEIYR